MSGIGKRIGKRLPEVRKSEKRSSSDRADLQFPVSRIYRYMRKGSYAKRVSATSAVYVAAVLEYLVAEILELGGNEAKAEKKKCISPRHLNIGIRNDEDLNNLLQGATIAGGGVNPYIHPVLRPRKDGAV